MCLHSDADKLNTGSGHTSERSNVVLRHIQLYFYGKWLVQPLSAHFSALSLKNALLCLLFPYGD